MGDPVYFVTFAVKGRQNAKKIFDSHPIAMSRGYGIYSKSIRRSTGDKQPVAPILMEAFRDGKPAKMGSLYGR
jgi:hypothetical protein